MPYFFYNSNKKINLKSFVELRKSRVHTTNIYAYFSTITKRTLFNFRKKLLTLSLPNFNFVARV